MSEFTDDQILDAIAAAVGAQDMPAAAGLIRMLAVQAPDKAQQIYDAVVHGTVTVTVPIR